MSAVGRPDRPVDDVLERLLAAGRATWRAGAFGDARLEISKAQGAAEDRGPQLAVPARIAVVLALRELTALDEVRGDEQSPGERVEAADVGMEQVRSINALAAQLRVEVEASRRDPSGAEDL